ncbi:MAG: hypothetical protein LUD02_04185 [Tannerellaceae bacterium]|nr:hypothetical protein [Tannerellaceae bacterium]
MKEINFITLFLLLIFLLNCKGTEVGQPNFASPNYFNEIWAVPGIYYYPANNPTIQPIKANIENNEVSASEFCLALFATDDIPYIPTLGEEEKEQGDFDRLPFWHKEYRYVPHQKEIENILIRDALIECISEHVRMHGRYSFTYIIDKIINIDITADVTLWGIQAGNSLNECFYLFRTPIISGETYTLIDCNQSGQDWSVNDWVAHTPVGHEDSYFKFKTIPEELPVEVKFTINVTSEKNKSFIASTKSIYITKE